MLASISQGHPLLHLNFQKSAESYKVAGALRGRGLARTPFNTLKTWSTVMPCQVFMVWSRPLHLCWRRQASSSRGLRLTKRSKNRGKERASKKRRTASPASRERTVSDRGNQMRPKVRFPREARSCGSNATKLLRRCTASRGTLSCSCSIRHKGLLMKPDLLAMRPYMAVWPNLAAFSPHLSVECLFLARHPPAPSSVVSSSHLCRLTLTHLTSLILHTSVD